MLTTLRGLDAVSNSLSSRMRRDRRHGRRPSADWLRAGSWRGWIARIVALLLLIVVVLIAGDDESRDAVLRRLPRFPGPRAPGRPSG